MFLALAPALGLFSLDLLVGASLVFLLGLVDDVRSLSPPVKLVVQTAAACFMVAGPLEPGAAALLFDGSQVFAVPITVAWYVGMANSVNLLDNMDSRAEAALKSLMGVAATFPKRDNDPQYRRRAANEWDVSVTVKSQQWKRTGPSSSTDQNN